MEMRPEDLGLADKGSFPFSYLLLHKFQIKNYSEIVLIKKKKKRKISVKYGGRRVKIILQAL